MRGARRRALGFAHLEPRWLLSSTRLGGEFRVNATTAGQQLDATVALRDDGSFVMAWSSGGQDGSGNGVYAQIYAADGSVLKAEFPVNVTSAGNQDQPSLAVTAGGAFVVAWSGEGDGQGRGIYFRVFSAAGLPLTGDLLANSTTAADQTNPAIAAGSTANDFVLAWQSDLQDGEGFGVFARRFALNGQALGGEIPINQTVAGDQQFPAVVRAVDGTFRVAWTSDGSFSGGDEVVLRAFGANDQPLTAELPVNQATSGPQSLPALAISAEGDTVVAWQSYGQDSAGYGVYARRFNQAAQPQGDEFPVNVTTSGAQWFPAVAMDADGDFVVAWRDELQDSGTAGIYARGFHRDGQPATAEYPVNSHSPQTQQTPALGMQPNGDFVAAWASLGQDGSLFGIYAQRFASPASVDAVEIRSSRGIALPYTVPVGSGEQLRTVPVGGMDQIHLRFSKALDVDQDDLTVSGVRLPSYAVRSFQLDPDGRGATWTLASKVEADRLTLRLDDSARDALWDLPLDGEWTNPTSLDDIGGSLHAGDGCPGGAFAFQVTVLVGDATRNNIVSGGDYTEWADFYDDGQGPPDKLFVQGDFDGDGHVSGADYTLWADYYEIEFLDPEFVDAEFIDAELASRMAWTGRQSFARALTPTGLFSLEH